MAEIYVPIDFSEVKNVIPPGEDIIYSSLAKGMAVSVVKNKRFTWQTHFLATNNGVAITIPLNVSYTKRAIKKLEYPSPLYYIPWGNIIFNKYNAMVVYANADRPLTCTFLLLRNKNFETKEKFKERRSQFAPKFSGIQIAKRKQLHDELHSLLKSYPKLPKRTDFLLDKNNSRFDVDMFLTIKKRIKQEQKWEKKS